MNREEMPRIRLKVSTTAGINILCTALRRWKVSEWLPHIEQAYREVKQEQGEDENSKQRFIKALRIKKGDFCIAHSEIIGDVFEDNDEVQCEIAFPNNNKALAKQRKINKKQLQRSQHLELHNPIERQEIIVEREEDQESYQKKQIVVEEQQPHKKRKIQLPIDQHQEQPSKSNNKTGNQPDKHSNNKGNKKVLELKLSPIVSIKKDKKQILQKIDISKLKTLIVKSDKKFEKTSEKKPTSAFQNNTPLNLSDSQQY